MPGLNIKRHDFADRAALADALAATVADALAKAIEKHKGAVLAVSGGSTPGLFFDVLSQKDIGWTAVTVALVDERFVPETSPRSNTALVKAKLLRNRASVADFRPLYHPVATVEEAAHLADDEWDAGDDHCDVVVLGMGNDGHTASLFPDAVELPKLLDPASRSNVEAVHAESAGEPRLTMPLAAIANSRLVLLHIEGSEKLATLEKALAAGSTLPIRRVIDAAKTPVEIFWAP